VSTEEKELGILLIDLGGGTTDVGLFRDGAIWYTGILPLGGDHISNDIAVGLRTPTSDAEELKKRHGCALTALVREDETIEVPSVGGRKARHLSRHILSEIIQPRVEEIFTLVVEKLQESGYADRVVPGGAILTGGGALSKGIEQCAERILQISSRLGLPQGVTGPPEVLSHPSFATAIGLISFPRGGASFAGFGRGRSRTAWHRRFREWAAELWP
ncbi:MAG: cell division protein FtsA, partial [Elusimicrobia bacterium]|nr:cell division protein FtsA [Elusimicrobiota bacterium]